MRQLTVACGCLIFIHLFLISECAEKARYDNYRVYEIAAENENHMKIFQSILDNPDGYRFMTSPPAQKGMKTRLIVPPHKFGDFSEMVERFQISAMLVDGNLQNSIDKEEARYNRRKSLDWSSFWRASEIYAWMNQLAQDQPSNISTFSIGTSYEGREIKGLRINVGGASGKPKIFFEGNIHANEWIGSATITYIINELLTSTDLDVIDLLEHFEWWFLPILNIDGYEYTWNVDRTWRKTRRETANPLCRGADPNRNWDVNWGSYGGSPNGCSSGYYGDFAFSEPETKNLADFLNTQFSNTDLFGYISFHSYGQLLMTPYAYSRENASNHELLMDIGAKAVETILSFRNAAYDLGTINKFFGLVAGSSVDYVAINQRPNIIYCYELANNHILADDEIKKVGAEIFGSIKTIFQEVINRNIA